MREILRPHPDTPCAAVREIAVELARPEAERLALRYIVAGDVDRLVLPPPAAPRRADELWRRTCFELFLRPEPGEAYEEFNFAPSAQWAAYRFSGYRAGMSPVPESAAPRIESRRGGGLYELKVALPLAAQLAHAPARLALSAVIEETDGAKSYWALAHPPGKPDFHHAAGLRGALPEPERR